MSQLCIYCLKEPGTTADHVPPKVCFPSPRPSNLITVPACPKCNLQFSKDDEMFASLLSLRVGIHEEVTQRLHDKNRRIVAYNARIRTRIAQKTQRVLVRDKSSIVGETLALHWDGNEHDAMIARIVRGLYFHRLGVPLPLEVPISASWQQPFNGDLLKLWIEWPGENIGTNGEFSYRYGRAQEDPTYSVWMMIFFGRHFAAGQTGDCPKTAAS